MRLRELMDELDNSLFECDGTGEMEVIRRCHQVMNERIEELEDKNTKLNEEVERWIDIHGLDVMQLAKKDKRIKELEADNKELWSQVT